MEKYPDQKETDNHVAFQQTDCDEKLFKRGS